MYFPAGNYQRIKSTWTPNIRSGTTGENILIEGIEVGQIQPGSIVRFPNVELVVTQDAPHVKPLRNHLAMIISMLFRYKSFQTLLAGTRKLAKKVTVEIK